MTQQMLTVTTRHVAARVAVLAAAGELDHDSRAVLADAAEAALHGGHDRLVIDLTELGFCDSGGLALFVDLHRRTTAGTGQVHLAGLQPPVAVVLHAANLDRILPLHPTVEEAVRAATPTG
ncbi:STAS domain-containing protein [Amorphoplanes nipponensis]|uniref:Anti-sigma factor antagonist n=1 Tax=Actinoplanes nipponensis TaxID=135950 RepID=A0A919JQU2_9ACTN|nr:STAS domain-containing protein [Actinoplanes nipponensis]GIE53655.1 anti-sigma factor antagonist [Actinoplanes nipponensis]